MIQSPNHIRQQLQNKIVVFTNGCFDVIHPGHIYILERAKALGDVLIVGLNSDASVKRLKGASRPIFNQNDRSEILDALKSVDYVTIFEEDTPLKLIEFFKPDVLVKGGDWPIEKIVGYDFVASYGGMVKSIPYIQGYSTTHIIEKIQKNL
jgi:rfaE bifunctional protein nucleotidyltransferase chain/domain